MARFGEDAPKDPPRAPDPRVFELLVQGVTDYAIYMLDPDGMIASWNPGARALKGYEAEEIIGQHFSRFFTEEDKTPACRRGAGDGAPGRPVRGRGLARAQGRHPLLGQRRPRSDPRR